MGGRPQVRGVVTSTFVLDPSKPNSSKKKCARVQLNTGYEVTAYIPGEKHDVREHSMVLVRPASNPDLHGVRFQIIRGALDASSPDRNQARSRYGVKKA
jgi:small subunit ribosomal protein S12